MRGLLAYATYTPRWRLSVGRRKRAVAGADEDVVTMGVAAARAATAGAQGDWSGRIWFATTRPVYAEKSSGALAAAALGVFGSSAADLGGSAAVGAVSLGQAFGAGQGVAILSDMRYGAFGSADEQQGCDGAASFVFGDGPIIATMLGQYEESSELHDRWRNDRSGAVWDDRFGAAHFSEKAERAYRALKTEADHVVVSTPYGRLGDELLRRFQPKSTAMEPSLGYAGAAEAGFALARCLDIAEASQTIVLIDVVDGVRAIALRVEPGISAYRSRSRAASSPRECDMDIAITDYLGWRELIERDPARRRGITAPSAPGAARGRDWKFGLVGARCSCGALNLPPQRICYACRRSGEMTAEDVSRREATVVTYTLDYLSPSGRPEAIAILDVDGGGRFQAYLSAMDARQLTSGARVRFAFRLLGVAANGIRNYFWKGVVLEKAA